MLSQTFASSQFFGTIISYLREEFSSLNQYPQRWVSNSSVPHVLSYIAVESYLFHLAKLFFIFSLLLHLKSFHVVEGFCTLKVNEMHIKHVGPTERY